MNIWYFQYKNKPSSSALCLNWDVRGKESIYCPEHFHLKMTWVMNVRLTACADGPNMTDYSNAHCIYQTFLGEYFFSRPLSLSSTAQPCPWSFTPYALCCNSVFNLVPQLQATDKSRWDPGSKEFLPHHWTQTAAQCKMQCELSTVPPSAPSLSLSSGLWKPLDCMHFPQEYHD